MNAMVIASKPVVRDELIAKGHVQRMGHAYYGCKSMKNMDWIALNYLGMVPRSIPEIIELSQRIATATGKADLAINRVGYRFFGDLAKAGKIGRCKEGFYLC